MVIFSSILLFILNINISHAALTATTANTIEGTKPYLSAAHLADINGGNDFNLLGVKFDTNEYFTDSDISTKLSNLSLTLGDLTPTTFAQKLGDGATGATSVIYKTPVATTDALDGDGFIAGSLSGTATVKGWYYDQNGTETQLQPAQLTQTFCDLAYANIEPYIKLEGPVTLSTQYGDPRTEVYDTKLEWGGATTAGATVGKVTNGNIDAEITGISASKITITLKGPAATMYLTGETVVAASVLNQNFVIEGRDASNSVKVSYGFKLKKWYVNRGSVWAPAKTGAYTDPVTRITYNNQKAWREGLAGASNYTLPKAEGLSNGSGTASGSGGTIPTMLNSNPNGAYYETVSNFV